MDVGQWPKSLVDECWKMLCQFVQGDREGAGLTCHYENPLGSDSGQPCIKVFCNGLAVPYAFILLYTGSESRIKRTGAAWIDNDCQVVVSIAAED